MVPLGHRRNPDPGNDLLNVAHGNGAFIAVGNLGTIIQSRYIGPPILGQPRFHLDGGLELSVTGKLEQNYRLQSHNESGRACLDRYPELHPNQ